MSAAFSSSLSYIGSCRRSSSFHSLYSHVASGSWPVGLPFLIANMTMMAGMVAMASGTLGGLYIGVLLSGLVFGGYWTIIPLAMGDLYVDPTRARYLSFCLARALLYVLLPCSNAIQSSHQCAPSHAPLLHSALAA